MNPGNIMKLMGAKNKFQKTHPKVVAFFGKIIREGVPEGSVITMSVEKPDGTKTETNMRVQPSDLELLEELKNLK